MEFNLNFTSMLQSATAEDNVYHKDKNKTFPYNEHCVLNKKQDDG
jgi:hypothetical protein